MGIYVIARGLSASRRYSTEQHHSVSPKEEIDALFLEDLVDMLFCSLNKYIASLLARQLSEWAYQLANRSYSRKILLPGMHCVME